MRNTFTILFYPKRTKINKDGQAPIYAWVTINGKRLELGTKRNIEPDKWETQAGKAKGKDESALNLNSFLESFRNMIYDHYRALLDKQLPITPEVLRNAILGIGNDQKTIVEVFNRHNDQAKSRIGHEFTSATVERYEVGLRHLKQFMKNRYNLSDVPVAQIDHSFIYEYEYFLKKERKCSHNTSIQYIKNFKKIVRICLANGWITKNPFLNYQSKQKSVERDFLTWDELKAAEDKAFSIPPLELVRDIFVFSCYTGLAYVDAAKLTKEDLSKDSDGETWLHIFRTKTKGRTQVPLLPKAMEIVMKYESYPVNTTRGKLLPVMSNQKMNAYLKEIADLCNVHKKMSYHAARHTFATTVTLTNGVPIESVSAMLGHKSIGTTQIYARILKEKIGADMKTLKEKLSNCA